MSFIVFSRYLAAPTRQDLWRSLLDISGFADVSPRVVPASNRRLKVAINGFGRMGRLVLRAAWEAPELELVHINESRVMAKCARTSWNSTRFTGAGHMRSLVRPTPSLQAVPLQVEDIARVFKALGDQSRVRIVSLLAHGELCVCHIEDALGCPQSTISRHLAVLRNAKIVKTRRDGAWVHYALNRKGSPRLVAQLLEVVERFRTVPAPKHRACK